VAVAWGKRVSVLVTVTVMTDIKGVGETERVIVIGSEVGVIEGAEVMVVPGDTSGRVAWGMTEPLVQPETSTKTIEIE